MTSLFYTKATPREMAAACSVMESGCLVMGPHVEALEDELGQYFDFDKGGAVTCASGTDALVLALEGLRCIRGYGVVVPAMTFSATYEAVRRVGAVPIICDVDDQTLTPSLEQIRSAVTTAIFKGIPVAGVIAVHLYGWPTLDLEELASFCREHHMFLIEDCAQCFGASLNGKRLGTFGDAAAFSFYPTKPLGGIGDGGMAYFRDSERVTEARARRNHGRTPECQIFAGYNSRLDEINACVLRMRLSVHDNVTVPARRDISGRYHTNGLKKLSIKRKGVGVPYVYPIMVDDRSAVMARLRAIGVESRVHYEPPVSALPYVDEDCPTALWASKRVLSLPCHQMMTMAEVDRICDAVRAA